METSPNQQVADKLELIRNPHREPYIEKLNFRIGY